MANHPPMPEGKEPPLRFDFYEWEAAFTAFYKWHAEDEGICLVISTHWATSGYWVEKGPQECPLDVAYVYRTKAEVDALEQRIKDRIEETTIRRPGKAPERAVALGGLVI